ncbi:Heme A synthase, cytochrome oxidase biogenesis protein Cox15-CtaA [Candidatus Rhodobacter oscarellae]|uniref:Heme A synthase n=1 Tax=Candidatus Rhodobacter oscarellae TaxID=1675527 RepID=A0A0J9E1G3_9RHOB|nr:heme A synthase [Candidatus Rhodobacter lobularis]KMW56731.1 Heme A synthase, cytochrome oxidase biogenesis protein Cox15-CtaA [Candidatus Rhodobacter lobularis]
MTQKRSIFEEVGAEAPAETAKPAAGLIDRGTDGARRMIRAWLAVLFAMVVLMIAIGGLTRLTDSGLSITEWNVVSGALPPMSAEAWDTEFEKYRAIPEYQLQNKGMSLAEFKVIYWWEWGHRQLGRLVGLVWAAGFFFFLATRRIPTGWIPRLLALGALGGAQGAIGWWMVSSGLTGTMLDVASYRLATHLGLAFVILGLIAWFMLHLSRPERDLMQARRAREPRLQGHGTFLIGVVFVQILLGALVAGIDAGRSYTDWPLMAGGLFPPGMWEIQPVWRNLFENDGTVQFIHRVWGYLTLAVVLRVWFVARRSSYRKSRVSATAMLHMTLLQIVLGVVTVMYSSPLGLALLHQLGAVALWVLVLRLRHRAQFPLAQSVREV